MWGIDIARHLIPRFIEQIAAHRTRVAKEQSAAQVELVVGGKEHHGLLKQVLYFTHIVLQVGVAFDVLPLLAAQQAVEGSGQTLLGVDVGLWFGKVESLNHVGVGRNGHQCLVFGFHAFHHYQAASLMQQADDAGENPLTRRE